VSAVTPEASQLAEIIIANVKGSILFLNIFFMPMSPFRHFLRVNGQKVPLLLFTH